MEGKIMNILISAIIIFNVISTMAITYWLKEIVVTLKDITITFKDINRNL
jgi:hypothetical protein